MRELQEYIVEQRQVGTQTYVVHAHSKAEAIRLARNGDATPIGFEIDSTGACRADATGAGDTRDRNPLAKVGSIDTSRDTCPEWNCPDLSTDDRREGKTCPDHPCTCSAERESDHG